MAKSKQKPPSPQPLSLMERGFKRFASKFAFYDSVKLLDAFPFSLWEKVARSAG